MARNSKKNARKQKVTIASTNAPLFRKFSEAQLVGASIQAFSLMSQPERIAATLLWQYLAIITGADTKKSSFKTQKIG